MAGNGPPPKDPSQRRRRNATVAMTVLPAEGRKKNGKWQPAPKWPLPADIQLTVALEVAQEQLEDIEQRLDEGLEKAGPLYAAKKKLQHRVRMLEATIKSQSDMERDLWRDLWRTPQAVAWERMHWTREVAQYVRWKVKAECGDLDASKEARQLADRLGLNPVAMLRLRWTIAEDEVAARRRERTDAAPAAKTRPRPRAVDSSGG